jgi:hypothetical protein
MRKTLLFVPMLALFPWIACNEQPASPTAQGGDYQELPPAQAPALQAMEGMLTKVDPAGKMIWIRTADGIESRFSYSDLTLVAGADNTVEGLAKMNGSRVRIRYTVSGAGYAAEEIEILSGQTPDPAERIPGDRGR